MKKTINLLNESQRFEMLLSLKKKNPNPKSQLVFNNPFELLCAVVLSAQATDESVNRVTSELFSLAPTPEKMVKLSAAGIAPIIKSIGLWKAKSSYLEKLSLKLVNDFGGAVPNNYDDLISLPGVGSKTAKVVLNVAFGQPTIAVDTHIFRVCNRTGFCYGKNAHEVEENIVDKVDDSMRYIAHHLLLLHGRYVCKARNPNCENCVIKGICKRNGV